MPTLKEEFDDLANELMNGDFVEAKYPITLTNASAGFDPITQTATGGESQSLEATALEIEQSQFDGANIKIGDKFALIRNAELTINILNNITSFSYDLTAASGGVYVGKVINTKTDPLGVTTELHLRS